MNAQAARYGRAMRLRAAAAKGIRLVPAQPKRGEYPFIPFACSVAPTLCASCSLECGRTAPGGAP